MGGPPARLGHPLRWSVFRPGSPAHQPEISGNLPHRSIKKVLEVPFTLLAVECLPQEHFNIPLADQEDHALLVDRDAPNMFEVSFLDFRPTPICNDGEPSNYRIHVITDLIKILGVQLPVVLTFPYHLGRVVLLPYHLPESDGCMVGRDPVADNFATQVSGLWLNIRKGLEKAEFDYVADQVFKLLVGPRGVSGRESCESALKALYFPRVVK